MCVCWSLFYKWSLRENRRPNIKRLMFIFELIHRIVEILYDRIPNIYVILGYIHVVSMLGHLHVVFM